jgi:hypothetical protein
VIKEKRIILYVAVDCGGAGVEMVEEGEGGECEEGEAWRETFIAHMGIDDQDAARKYGHYLL